MNSRVCVMGEISIQIGFGSYTALTFPREPFIGHGHILSGNNDDDDGGGNP